jgi:hypothetical protein
MYFSDNNFVSKKYVNSNTGDSGSEFLVHSKTLQNENVETFQKHWSD